MKPIPYRDVKRKLESAGFSITTQTQWSGQFCSEAARKAIQRLKYSHPQKRDCAMDSLQNILTDALTTVGGFTKFNGRFCTPYS